MLCVETKSKRYLSRYFILGIYYYNTLLLKFKAGICLRLHFSLQLKFTYCLFFFFCNFTVVSGKIAHLKEIVEIQKEKDADLQKKWFV